MGFNGFYCVIDGNGRVVFVLHLLPFAEGVLEIIQDFERLEVILLIINDCLETCHTRNGPYSVHHVGQTLEQVVVRFLKLLNFSELSVVLELCPILLPLIIF